MGDALLHWRQCHIIAISALQIILIAYHRLIHLSLELDIYRRGDIRSRKTTLYLRAGLRQIANGIRWYFRYDKFSDLVFYLLDCQRPILIDDICKTRLKGIAF